MFRPKRPEPSRGTGKFSSKPPARQDLALKKMPARGLESREVALWLFEEALSTRGGFEAGMLDPRFTALDIKDRAFARLLAITLLRELGRIDALLGEKLHARPIPPLYNILRLGAAQILFRLAPDFAAVSTSLNMVDKVKNGYRHKGLCNAVLRGLARETPQAKLQKTDVRLNIPSWLRARWTAAYGDQAVLEFCRIFIESPPTDLTPKHSDQAKKLLYKLNAASQASSSEAIPSDTQPVDLDDFIAPAPESSSDKGRETTLLPMGQIRTWQRGAISSWPGYREGDWWIQDLSASVAVRLLGNCQGKTALDLCAAPGGKTLQLAAGGALVTALDSSKGRLDKLKANLERTGLKARLVHTRAEDFKEGLYDIVLLDAPCTASGTFRRHPDVVYSLKPADITKLAGIQSKLLESATFLVKPGGRLVYSVCSLEMEEGEVQVRDFLKRHPQFSRIKLPLDSLFLPACFQNKDGDLRILPQNLPHKGSQDGFFIAVFTRADGVLNTPI